MRRGRGHRRIIECTIRTTSRSKNQMGKNTFRKQSGNATLENGDSSPENRDDNKTIVKDGEANMNTESQANGMTDVDHLMSFLFCFPENRIITYQRLWEYVWQNVTVVERNAATIKSKNKHHQ